MLLSETLRKIQPVPKYFPTASVLVSAFQFGANHLGRLEGTKVQ